MDRREALKKMAVGGATVAGATAVMSSPAFAYSQPLSATPPSITWNFPFPTSFRNKLSLNCTAGAATCPQSSTSPNKAGQLTLLNATITATFSPVGDPTNSNLAFLLWYFNPQNVWNSGNYSQPLPNPWNFLTNAHGPSGTLEISNWAPGTVRLLKKRLASNHQSAGSGNLLSGTSSLSSYTTRVRGFLPAHVQGGSSRTGDIITLVVRQGFRCLYATGNSSVRTFQYSNWQWRPDGDTALTYADSNIDSEMNFEQIVAPTVTG